jgi:hypothetical protein
MSASTAAGDTQTAVINKPSSSRPGGMTPPATASRTPEATPSCAAPQVSVACASEAIMALFTNRVIGLTGRFGWATTTKAA